MQICYVRNHYFSTQLQVNELSAECNHLPWRIGYTGNVTRIAQEGDNRVTMFAGAGVTVANIQVALKKYQIAPGY
jgi:hypothetical protein